MSADDGWVLVSDSIPASGNVAPTLHHRHGCNQSNGASQLVVGTPEQIAERPRCLKCQQVVGDRVLS